jgi:D-alanine-D-alanine ligase
MHYTITDLPAIMENLQSKLRIAVTYSGDKNDPDAVIYKTHNPRSWKSYQKVAEDIQETLKEIGFKYVFTLPENKNLLESLRKENIHLVWINSAGVQGYSPMSHTPAMLEMIGVPYVGHHPVNAAKLDNKYAFKLECQGCGIPTAPFMNWNGERGKLMPKVNKIFKASFGSYDGPFVVKPVSGRASLLIYVVDTIDELPEVVDEVYSKTLDTVLIEKYLGGREFCVAVCGNVYFENGRFTYKRKPFAFSPIERVLDEDERIFTSMDKKPITGARAKLMSKAEDSEIMERLKALGETVYLDLALESLIRLDIRADEMGDLKVLEANPKPDLKKPSETVTNLICIGLAEHDMDYNDLIRLVLANRLHQLFTHKMHLIGHIAELMT